MKTIFRKLVPIIVVASLLLTACGANAPETIDWTTAEDTGGFGEIGDVSGQDDVEYSNTDTENDNNWEYTSDLGVCSLGDQNAGNCFGDETMGFRELSDGSYKVFVDGDCYILDGNNADDIASMKVAMAQIKEKTDYVNGYSSRAGMEAAVLISSIAGLSACSFLGASNPVGWACALGLLGLAASTGLGVMDLIDINKAGDEIEAQTQELHRIVSGQRRCN